VGDLGHVGGEEAREGGQRLHREPWRLAGERGQHPQPHQWRHRRQGKQVRRQRGERDRPELVRHQRGRGERRGDRHPGALGEDPPPAGHASPIVALSWRSEELVANRSCPEQDPDHGGEAQLPADVVGCPRVDRQGDEGGERDRVPARPRPCGERGRHPRRAHHAGSLDGGTCAGDRHVDRDQRQNAEQTGADRDAQERQQRHRQQRKQHHVLPRDGE
jgi:hypothetical protein